VNRRRFLQNAAWGALGVSTGRLAAYHPRELPSIDLPKLDIHAPVRAKPSPLGMPGLFPGRVVEVSDPGCIVKGNVSEAALRAMVERGMKELTGEKTAAAAWKRFVGPQDVVGLKVNASGAPLIMTTPGLLRVVAGGVLSAEVKRENLFVYERYPGQLMHSGYDQVIPAGVRIVGVESKDDPLAGYDPEVYFAAKFFDEPDPRSLMARIVSQRLTKIINLPNFKEHNAAGVTGCLKNVSYGSFSNVGRTHQPPVTYTDPLIPILCAIEPLRSKVVLNIMDALYGVWHAGPFASPPTFLYEVKSLYFGTDPVAIDRLELAAIEKKRLQEGAPSLWDRDPSHLTNDFEEVKHDPYKNPFYRAPQYIQRAATMGLGVWDTHKIDHRRIVMG